MRRAEIHGVAVRTSKDPGYFSRLLGQNQTLREKLIQMLGFFRSRSSGNVVHDKLCFQACVFTQSNLDDNDGLRVPNPFTNGIGHKTFVDVADVKESRRKQMASSARPSC